jgi:tetratricopeptide (TPR) repeat protein
MSYSRSDVNWLEILQWSDDHLCELRGLGYGFLKEGRYDRALVCFETLTLLCPDESYDWQTLGALSLENGQYASALEALERALELDPLHLPTLLNKAKTLLIVGQTDEGLALARSLERAADPRIAGPASALVLGYDQLL